MKSTTCPDCRGERDDPRGIEGVGRCLNVFHGCDTLGYDEDLVLEPLHRLHERGMEWALAGDIVCERSWAEYGDARKSREASKHLRLLADCGWVEVKREKRRLHFRLTPAAMRAFEEEAKRRAMFS